MQLRLISLSFEVFCHSTCSILWWIYQTLVRNNTNEVGAAIFCFCEMLIKSPCHCMPAAVSHNCSFCFSIHEGPPFIEHHLQYFISQILYNNIFSLRSIHYLEWEFINTLCSSYWRSVWREYKSRIRKAWNCTAVKNMYFLSISWCLIYLLLQAILRKK